MSGEKAKENPAAESRRLFETILQLCGLSPVLAPGTLRRALRDVGADPATATAADYWHALPKLEARLRVYFRHDEARERMQNIQNALRRT